MKPISVTIIALSALLWNACIKEQKHPSKDRITLPNDIRYDYEHFQETDTIIVTGIKGNTIGFAYRDYYDQFKWPGLRAAWFYDENLRRLANMIYKRAFGENRRIDQQILSQYEFRLELLRPDGSHYIFKEWPLLSVTQN